MRQLLSIIFLFISGYSFAQNFTYPTINKHGQNINAFIPSGWMLLDSTQGDLNNDKINDIALVIQHKDSVSLITKEDNDFDTIVTQPRILVIAFYSPSAKRYELIEQSNSFILNHDDPDMEEPYRDISIINGILKIDFGVFMNVGGWGMSNNYYRFRYQQKEFVLIGADDNSVQRNTGETEDRSYNFLTKMVKIATGTISSDKQKVKWRKFKLPKLQTLKTFKQPFTWEIETDYYL